jgi:cytidylate kinase
MTSTLGLDRCLSFINTHLTPAARPSWVQQSHLLYRSITISRQVGCGARDVAEKLAAILQQHALPDSPPWTVFDRNLMDKVLEDHHLPARLAQFLPEDRVTRIQEIVDSLIGMRPVPDTVVQQTMETILRLADIGNVILIGRAGNIITAQLPGVLHIRLVAPLEKRIQHSHDAYNMSLKEAREFCEHEDLGRARYVKKYYGVDVNDPLHYHIVLNTGLMTYDRAAELIARAMKK